MSAACVGSGFQDRRLLAVGVGEGEAPQYVSAKQAAALLGGVSEKLVYKLFKAGTLVGLQVGRAVRIDLDSVLAHRAACSNKRPPADTPPEAPVVPVRAPARKVNRRPRPAASGFVFLPPKQYV